MYSIFFRILWHPQIVDLRIRMKSYEKKYVISLVYTHRHHLYLRKKGQKRVYVVQKEWNVKCGVLSIKMIGIITKVSFRSTKIIVALFLVKVFLLFLQIQNPVVTLMQDGSNIPRWQFVHGNGLHSRIQLVVQMIHSFSTIGNTNLIRTNQHQNILLRSSTK